MPCGPGYPELLKSDMDIAGKLFTFTFAGSVEKIESGPQHPGSNTNSNQRRKHRTTARNKAVPGAPDPTTILTHIYQTPAPHACSSFSVYP